MKHRVNIALGALVAAVAAGLEDTGVQMMMGVGGGPEGVTVHQYYAASMAFSGCMGMHLGTSAAVSRVATRSPRSSQAGELVSRCQFLVA